MMQPPSPPVEEKTKYAYLWQRFVAVTLDEIITLILFAPAIIIQSVGVGGTWPIILFAAAAFLRYLYFVYFEHRKGQTIGKSLFRIKVRSEHGDRLPLKEALVRNLRRFEIFFGLALPADLTTIGTWSRLLVALFIFYTFVGPIFIWMSVKKQRPLDMLVHTVVIQVEQPLPAGR